MTKIRAVLEGRKRESAIAAHLVSTRKLESTGDLNDALSHLATGLLAYPDEPQLLEYKQALELQLRAVEAARQDEKQVAAHEESAKRLHSAGDLHGALTHLQQGLSEFHGEPRLLKMKSIVEKSIAEAEELKRREEERRHEVQERRRQEEERQRVREEKAAREAEKRKQDEAEKLRLEQIRKQKEKAAREAEKKEREEAEKQRLEQLRKRKEEARARAEEEKHQRQERQAKEKQAAALKTEDIQKVPPEFVAKVGGAKVWLSVAAAVVIVVVIAVMTHFLGRNGTLVVRNAAPGTVVGVEKTTYAVGPDGAVRIPLKPGPHEVELAKDGYQSKELHIDIAGGKELALNDTALTTVPVPPDHLIPKPGHPNGSLIIETGNKDVSVYIDGVKQNNARRGTLRVSLPPVEHEIRAERAGYVSRSVRTLVSSNGENKIDMRLGHETPAPPHARLSIQGATPGSQILVDGQNNGAVGADGTFSADVPGGDHEISMMTDSQKTDAINRHFAQGTLVKLNGAEFKIAPLPNTTDDNAWQQVQDARSISALEGFLQRFPNSAHRGEAEPKLDDLYWAKASETNTPADFRDYQNRYPNGRHSRDAQSELAKLDWQQAQNTSDPRVLEDFVKKYSSGGFHDQAAAKLDDLAWQRAAKANDATGLRDYLSRFPNGKHAEQARSAIDQLAASKPPARVEAVDERAAVLSVLQRYKKAYEEESVAELQAIWPAMGPRQISNLGVFFKTARAVSLAYNLVGEPETNGTSSTVTFTQSLNFIINGKQQKTSAQVTIQLKKAGPGNWLIESIR